MAEQTEQQKWDQFNYLTDPATHAIISTMVDLAVPDPEGYDPHHELRRRAALDFFVYGTTMLLIPATTRHSLTLPWHWLIKPDGTAEFQGKVPDSYAGPRPVAIPPEDYLLLALEEPLPAPTHDEGEVQGADPWLAAWAKASKRLDTFLARAA